MAKPNKQGVINRDVNAAQRAQLAVKYRAQRLTFDEIAQKAGYASPGAARNAIQRELQRTMSIDVDELRREELDMLDRLHAAVWPLAVVEAVAYDQASKEPIAVDEKGKKKVTNLFAVDRIVAISERRCKLMGLDTRPDELVANVNYTKKIIIVPPTGVPNASTNG